MRSSEAQFDRYREMQRYVGWTDEDAERILNCAGLVAPSFRVLVDDFYDAISRHAQALQVIRGGPAQIVRLKKSLTTWLTELLSGPYDQHYVQARWQVGEKHVEVQLDQIYVTIAMSRLRTGLLQAMVRSWRGSAAELAATQVSLNKLLDLDLAIIEDSYQSEHLSQRQENERLAMLTQLAEFVPLFIVRPDMTLCYFSPCAEALTGYPSTEALSGNGLPLFLESDDRALLTVQMERTFSAPGTRTFESTVRRRDGVLRRLLWNARRLDDFEGAAAVLAVGHDITERKIADEQARRKERLAAIGQTVTGLAHESRNALQRSKACLELLALEIADRPAALDLVTRVQKAQDHLHHLLEEVRAYAAPINLEKRPCRLEDIWRETWADLADDRAGKSIAFSEHLGRINLRVTADSFAVRQVFRNILENAVAACAERGQVCVHAAETTLAEKPAVQIRFSDSGPGLNAEQRKRIFEPFYTTKTKGTGLGMAIASRLVEAHAGEITLGESQPEGQGKGAEIIVTLPRS